MVRVASLALAVSALGFAAALPAQPPKLSSPTSFSQCDKYTNGEGDAAVCGPVVDSLQAALAFQANNINTNADSILKQINEVTGGSSNPASSIVKEATNGLVSNLAYGAGLVLYGLSTAFSNAAPQCRCDISACTNALRIAGQDDSANTNNLQASCQQAKYQCAPYYSEKDVDKSVRGCAQFNGPTGSN